MLAKNNKQQIENKIKTKTKPKHENNNNVNNQLQVEKIKTKLKKLSHGLSSADFAFAQIASVAEHNRTLEKYVC